MIKLLNEINLLYQIFCKFTLSEIYIIHKTIQFLSQPENQHLIHIHGH